MAVVVDLPVLAEPVLANFTLSRVIRLSLAEAQAEAGYLKPSTTCGSTWLMSQPPLRPDQPGS
jgi:hypothetical protein